ncbi:UbiA family prenyltransferase [Pseudonocardia sp. TRM90224]|uniref:UbiA family prenyltransferase n=1 Tax=Pseudonocardia sp. TRM90224 TaxID=2812678 RepID=UPI001E5BECF5|nr:UbiA family prenyltransferase [Pseudonocardia sp. TRM90224]
MTAALAHVETWRPYTVWYVGLLGLAGAGLAGEHRPWWLAVAWATPTLGWLAAHYLGDYLDRNLDAIGKAHRPIPSGRLAPRTALTCGVAGMIAVGALATAAGWVTGLIAAGAVAGVLAYSGWLKANGLAGNLVRGLLGALTLLYGAAIVPAFDWRVLVFALAFCLHDTASNVVGTLRDVVGDRAGGYRTLPVERGTAAGVWTAVALYGLAVAAAAVGGRLQPAHLAVLAVVAAVGVLAFAPLVRLRAALPARVALRAHEVLVLERLGLAAAVVGLGIGPVPAVALLVPMVALTWWTQRRMRTWYELGPLDGPERTARDEA